MFQDQMSDPVPYQRAGLHYIVTRFRKLLARDAVRDTVHLLFIGLRLKQRRDTRPRVQHRAVLWHGSTRVNQIESLRRYWQPFHHAHFGAEWNCWSNLHH